jgi:hypothetical protein
LEEYFAGTSEFNDELLEFDETAAKAKPSAWALMLRWKLGFRPPEAFILKLALILANPQLPA